MVISLCDYTGNMVRPWAEAGWRCHCYDIAQDCPRIEGFGEGSIQFLCQNISTPYLKEFARGADIIFAFPPCTDLAVSGAKHFKAKGMRALIDALETVESCRIICESSGAPWMLENPVSTLSTYWREPDYIFDPYEYQTYLGGETENYTKGTCLWTGGGFVMPEKRPPVDMPLFGIEVAPPDDRIHKMAPGDDRAAKRAVTPNGFARAVFEANHKAES